MFALANWQSPSIIDGFNPLSFCSDAQVFTYWPKKPREGKNLNYPKNHSRYQKVY